MNEKRLAQLKALQAADPSDPFLPYAIGLEHVKAEQLEEAIGVFGELIRSFPDYLPTYYQQALALVHAGRADDAIGVLEMGVDLASRQGEGKTQLELESLLEDLEDAL